MARYALGWLPNWARIARLAPRRGEPLLHAPGLATTWRGARRDHPGTRCPAVRHRDVPGLVAPPQATSAAAWAPGHGRTLAGHVHQPFPPAHRPRRRAGDAGLTVAIPAQEACCGLTWISTGQLGMRTAAACRSSSAPSDGTPSTSPKRCTPPLPPTASTHPAAGARLRHATPGRRTHSSPRQRGPHERRARHPLVRPWARCAAPSAGGARLFPAAAPRTQWGLSQRRPALECPASVPGRHARAP